MPKIPGFRAAKRIRTMAALWHHRGDLFPMFRDMYKGRYRATFFTQIAMVLCALYVIMPFDFLPDWIPILGWADDAAMIYFFTRRIIGELERYRESKQTLKLVKLKQ